MWTKSVRTSTRSRFNALGIAKIVALACFALVATVGTGRAADITFLCSSAFEPAMQELIPEFEKASGHNVKVTYATSGAIAERVGKGEPADLAIVSPEQWDSLQKDGKLGPASRVEIAKVGIGMFVKKGAFRQDIGSVDAFKRALQGARSVAVADPSQSPVGAYVIPLLERLGIAGDVKPKLRLAGGGPAAIQSVADGDADIGLAQVTEIVASSNVDAVGPLPMDIQSYETFMAAIPASANHAAAQALAAFLRSSRAVSVLKSKGFLCAAGEVSVSQPVSCFPVPGEALHLMTRPTTK
jgi:molybdate transport system substrate-binding protein